MADPTGGEGRCVSFDTTPCMYQLTLRPSSFQFKLMTMVVCEAVAELRLSVDVRPLPVLYGRPEGEVRIF